MVTLVDVETESVDTENVVLVLPAGTVIREGTVATEVLLLVSDTTTPPEGAGPFRVTLPSELVAPVTEVGFKATELTAGGVTVSVPVVDEPL